jgi:hypothetical protein
MDSLEAVCINNNNNNNNNNNYSGVYAGVTETSNFFHVYNVLVEQRGVVWGCHFIFSERLYK